MFLAPDARRMEELGTPSASTWPGSTSPDGRRNSTSTPTQMELATTRRDGAKKVVDQRISTSYIWVMFPDQPDADRPMELSGDQGGEPGRYDLAERVSDRLHREGQLAAVHSARAIHQRLTGQLKPLWDRGYISVGELWDLYTTYPYLPRLRDRSVMEEAVRQALNSIHLGTGGLRARDRAQRGNRRFTGLAIPHGDASASSPTHVLLVRPDIALHQRRGQAARRRRRGACRCDHPAALERAPTAGAGGDPEPPVPPPAKTRYFAVFRVDPEKYGRDLTRLQQEILPHLADPEAGDLTITVEIEATRPGGFTEDKIRILRENARVLKFEQSDFE